MQRGKLDPCGELDFVQEESRKNSCYFLLRFLHTTSPSVRRGCDKVTMAKEARNN